MCAKSPHCPHVKVDVLHEPNIRIESTKLYHALATYYCGAADQECWLEKHSSRERPLGSQSRTSGRPRRSRREELTFMIELPCRAVSERFNSTKDNSNVRTSRKKRLHVRVIAVGDDVIVIEKVNVCGSGSWPRLVSDG